MKYKRLSAVCGVVFCMGLANFLAFCLIASFSGGDAWHGKIVSGHHYLNDHGEFTEVSPARYHASKIHVISLFVTQPLMVLAAVLAGVFDKKAKKATPGDGLRS